MHLLVHLVHCLYLRRSVFYTPYVNYIYMYMQIYCIFFLQQSKVKND